VNGNLTKFIPDSLPKRLLALGGAALLVLLGGSFFNRQEFFRAYLSAYLFMIGFPLGSLAILMLHHLVGGRWGFMTQRLLEAAVGTMPLAALLFLPLLLGQQELYPWARPDAAADPILQEKSVYLNMPFFWARAAIYFAVWISLSEVLRRWSLAQDQSADPNLTDRLQSLGGPGLVLYGLTVTFSAIDWAMSLEPHWYSTIYGLIFVLNDGLAALALVICAAAFLVERGALGPVAGADRFHDLGNLLLALVMLWAYLNFSQFMIIWVENLHEEIPWVLRRTAGGWKIIALLLISCQFALPFLLLLGRTTKRKSRSLAAVGLLILLMRWIDTHWLITPAFHPQGFYIHWLDLAAPIAMGAVWLGVFLWRLEGRSLLPLHDPRFTEEMERAQRA
jgi:hypothetical protein